MMKTSTLLGALCLLMAVMCVHPAQAQWEQKAFSSLAVSLNGGTNGGALQLATPLNSFIYLRGGASFIPLSYSDTYSGYYAPAQASFKYDLKAKLNPTGMLVVDVHPFKKSGFHVTGGVVFGNRLATVSGSSPYPITIGDVTWEPSVIGIDEEIEAWVKIPAVRPYLGVGFGRAIPKKRVGFKVELGGIFQGSREIESTNNIIRDNVDKENQETLDKILSNLSVFPYLNLQLSIKLF